MKKNITHQELLAKFQEMNKLNVVRVDGKSVKKTPFDPTELNTDNMFVGKKVDNPTITHYSSKR